MGKEEYKDNVVHVNFDRVEKRLLGEHDVEEMEIVSNCIAELNEKLPERFRVENWQSIYFYKRGGVIAVDCGVKAGGYCYVEDLVSGGMIKGVGGCFKYETFIGLDRFFLEIELDDFNGDDTDGKKVLRQSKDTSNKVIRLVDKKSPSTEGDF